MFQPIEIYQSTQRRKTIYKILMASANRMLSKAKIVTNIETAMVLAKILKKHHESGIRSEQDSKDDLDLFLILMRCYESITDEVAIVSAFENYAKSILLRKQYIIHELSFRGKEKSKANVNPNQKINPFHIRTFKNLENENISLKSFTLPSSVLLSKNYVKHYSLSNSCINHLIKFNATRNLVHLDIKMTSSITLSEIEAINELKLEVERYS